MAASPMNRKVAAVEETLSPTPIVSHTWNKNLSEVVFAANSSEVFVHEVLGEDCAKWPKTQKLSEHDQKVLCVDWALKTNQIVTCSEDRTAYVWRWDQTNTKWAPSQVHLGAAINRAVLCCRWSPDENKFAVGTGANIVCICYYEEEQNWWLSKMIEAHKSSVTCVAWCPNNNSVLATGSTDGTARLYCAHLARVDGGKSPIKFGTQLARIEAAGWVQGLAWAPSATAIAFSVHNSTIGVANVKNGYDNISTEIIRLKQLPTRSIVFSNDKTIVAACFDYYLYLFTQSSSGEWVQRGRLLGEGPAPSIKAVSPLIKQQQQLLAAASGSSQAGSGGTAVDGARRLFQNTVNTGSLTTAEKLESRHQGAINDLRVLVSGDRWRISSAANDGQIYFWDAPELKE